MKGCRPHYHETLGLSDSVDTKLKIPPKCPLREDHGDLGELVSSIQEKELIEPIIVRPTKGMFEVVAGARRFEACKRLRWSRVPCIIRNLSDRDAFEMSLTEELDFLGAVPDRKDSTETNLEELDNGENILRLALARLTTQVEVPDTRNDRFSDLVQSQNG